MATEERSVIYAIECAGYFKVGMAKSLERRLETFRLHNPLPLRVAFWRSVPARYARRLEIRAHDRLRAFHHHGEWFAATEDDIKSAVLAAVSEVAELREVDRRLAKEGAALEAARREESVKPPQTPPPPTLAQIRKHTKRQMLSRLSGLQALRSNALPW